VFLAVAISKVLLVSKSAHGFCSKSFVSNWLRLQKSASKFSGKVLASKRLHLAKSVFHGLRFVWQSQVFKIGSKIFSESFSKFGLGFFARFIFFSKVNFSQIQFLAKVSASSRLWRFGRSVSFSKTKSGL